MVCVLGYMAGLIASITGSLSKDGLTHREGNLCPTCHVFRALPLAREEKMKWAQESQKWWLYALQYRCSSC